MQQLTLGFCDESSPRTLVDDQTGRIVYAPAVVDAARCTAWLGELQSSIDWRHERRPMYDRVVEVPRLTAHFDVGTPLPKVLRDAKRAVERFAGMPFNAVGLNLYRDGRDSVAMHSDHTNELVPGSPVALLSLGATRRMRIHSKARPRRIFDVALEAGSVLLMAGAAQDAWEHGIPKTPGDVGVRLSLAFRVRPTVGRSVD